MSKPPHIATCAILGGFSGKRMGTHLIYTFPEVSRRIRDAGFRWRNAEVQTAYQEWLDNRAQEQRQIAVAQGLIQ